MQCTALLLASLTLAGAAHGAEGDRLNARQWVISSATRILALDNNIRGDIAVSGEEEGHIGQRFEVNPIEGETCSSRCAIATVRSSRPSSLRS